MPVSGDPVLRVAARGDGVTASGRHAALAAPGDRVGMDGSIIPGPHHQTPPCRHFPLCGGCQLQHLDEASWADFITDRITGAMAAQQLSAPIRPPALSPPRTRRRATLHAERRGRQVHLGFTEVRSHRLVDLAECWVLAPALFRLLAPLRGLLAVLLTARRADIQLTLTDQGPDVLLTGVSDTGLATAEALASFARRHSLARLAIDEGGGSRSCWEPEPVTVTLGGVAVALPPGAFLQATDEGEAALAGAVREGIGAAQAVADLFAGLGTFSFVPEPAVKVYAAEAARDAVLALKTAANRAGRQVLTEHRDLYRRPLTAGDLNLFDAVILDPPRAGAQAQAVELAGSRAPVLVYVSCNPSSFARDVRLLCDGGYRLDWVQPVGQFRWSTHVELVGRISR